NDAIASQNTINEVISKRSYRSDNNIEKRTPQTASLVALSLYLLGYGAYDRSERASGCRI
ncbi:MAG: hypothetical protein QGI08_03185, partial [Paracoccaceae bacterium]|nr:hypothetical protein [Paracoccaceae bacterium]